jgi:hypothetical protein
MWCDLGHSGGRWCGRCSDVYGGVAQSTGDGYGDIAYGDDDLFACLDDTYGDCDGDRDSGDRDTGERRGTGNGYSLPDVYALSYFYSCAANGDCSTADRDGCAANEHPGSPYGDGCSSYGNDCSSYGNRCATDGDGDICAAHEYPRASQAAVNRLFRGQLGMHIQIALQNRVHHIPRRGDRAIYGLSRYRRAKDLWAWQCQVVCL